jgi:nucleotide-binding universal stress UspA family protein
MGLIVCATRGGEAGRRTQERAITLAKERDDPLVFLAVFDPDFSGFLSEPLADAIRQEQAWLGRAEMNVAQQRAHKRGVAAEGVVRSGPVMQGIQDFIRESCASTLVIGQPRLDSPLGTFQVDNVQSCAEQMAKGTGVEVVVVAPEEP